MQYQREFLKILTLIATLSVVVQLCLLVPIALCAKPTDLNSDGITDIDDINLAAESFASTLGHDRWNPDADIDEDGYVGIKDIIAIALEFGQESP